MVVYKTDGKWYVKVNGGHVNREIVPGESRGPFTTKPVPAAKWQEKVETESGYGVKVFTKFITPEEEFTIVSFRWYPAWGYSWEEEWEIFAEANIVPPKLGEAYMWTGDGWEPTTHPMEVGA